MSEGRRQRILRVCAARLQSVTLVLDAPHDPHNAAAIVRSCDAFAVQTLHVVPREETFRIASSVAKGSERWVDVVVHPTSKALLSTLTRGHYALIGAQPDGDLQPRDLAGVERVAIVLGNEHDGIRPELLSHIERFVRIPMSGHVRSLNLSVSAAILLQAATENRPGDLEARAQRLAYAKGLFASVNRPGEILAASNPC